MGHMRSECISLHQVEPICWQCCNFQSRQEYVSVAPIFWFLGGQPEQPFYKSDLRSNIIAPHPSNLPLSVGSRTGAVFRRSSLSVGSPVPFKLSLTGNPGGLRSHRREGHCS